MANKRDGIGAASKPVGGERLRRVDAAEILQGALDGLDGVPDTLAAELLTELTRDDRNGAQRIQEAIESAVDG